MRDESILYVPASESYCVLNRSAAVLWEALSAPATEDELATALVGQFAGASMESALSDVRTTLDEMTELALVREVT